MNRLINDTNTLLGQSLGTCTIQHLIGRGGMGAVYLAQQVRPRREVAVKVLIPGLLVDSQSRIDFLARFRREADAIAALDHVNIIPIYEYGEQGLLAYLVMPYLTGGSLREVLEKRGALPLNEVLPILEQAAAALDYAHAKGIIHRDLKPGNILFHSDGRVLLADFGLAKVLKETSDADYHGASALTSAGIVIGTPEYLSPEQATGQALDQRTDIYSLGILLFQMLTSRVPFSGATPVATAFQHAFSAPPSISQLNPTISPEIEAVVMKAIAKSPEQRYESAGQLVQALYATVSGAPPTHLDNGYKKSNSHILAPMILASTDTISETLDAPAHEAATVVDMFKPVGERTSPISPLPFSSTPVHSTSVPQQRNKRRRLRVAVLSIILILLLPIGGSGAYLYIAHFARSGHSVAHISQTGSPVSQATSIISPHLPPPKIQAGNLLYGTPLPGYLCDSSSASWSKTDNAHVLCDTSTTELSDTNSRHLAATFLNALPGGQSIPNDYILQVQVRQGPHSHGAFGILFRNQPNAASMGAYAFWLYPNNSWSSNVYDEVTRTETELYRHQTLMQLNGVVTIDIRVHGDTFNLFVNGREQGYAMSGKYPNGTIGLAVNPGANVLFSNFALYALPKS